MQIDTIYSLATPPGISAISIIRISGPRALQTSEFFYFTETENKSVNFRKLKQSDGSVIDEVLIVSFQSPSSSTGEDVLEIHCHGSEAVVKDILSVLEKADGFRVAEPGEFTRRAFDNGKVDLSMIEGLSDLFDAKTSLQRRQATSQMSGNLAKPINKWRAEIIEMLSFVEALIDFHDEELPINLNDKIINKRNYLIKNIEDVLSDNNIGEIIRNGLSAVIIGPVNSGKSTALNLISKRPASIVSNLKGTTRDIIEVQVNIKGIPIYLSDTAGFRKNAGLIEKEGIKRAKAASQNADIILIVIDGSVEGWKREVLKFTTYSEKKTLIVVNKIDKGLKGSKTNKINGIKTIFLSLKDNSSLAVLEKHISSFLNHINHEKSSTLITRSHHRESLIGCLQHLENSKKFHLERDIEIIAEEFRLAANLLGKITGHINVEDLLDEIFSNFCIGK